MLTFFSCYCCRCCADCHSNVKKSISLLLSKIGTAKIPMPRIYYICSNKIYHRELMGNVRVKSSINKYILKSSILDKVGPLLSLIIRSSNTDPYPSSQPNASMFDDLRMRLNDKLSFFRKFCCFRLYSWSYMVS